MKPLCRNEKHAEMKHCVEMNTQTNCRLLRIVKFDLKLLDC